MEGFIFGILLYLAVVRQRSKKTYQKIGFDDTAKMSLETQCLDLICKTCGFRVSHDQCSVNGTIIIIIITIIIIIIIIIIITLLFIYFSIPANGVVVIMLESCFFFSA